MPSDRPRSCSLLFTSRNVVSPKLRTSSSSSSVRFTRSRTVVIPSDPRHGVTPSPPQAVRPPPRQLQLGQAHVQLPLQLVIDLVAGGRQAVVVHGDLGA